ncbi:type II toxin-antitoxin system VapC family toxin [Falsiroseomonas sp.]|uniref:type II toxin-antitoxin system VapC family toxin n=1 Tax=Falsiroseomonas sp. TaxID=2870721 RepID=UPI00271F26A1|nr:type II toxin-antitoxin system VapC family toxin [Falsiroseomonas sp.]MDO9502194.1 type II toxin-antitoxin system VapC family toxin [Falsiroseomonas sp.]
MILDTSALMAVLFKERDFEAFGHAMTQADHVAISAATLVEATIVVTGRDGDQGAADLRGLLAELRAEVVPVTERAAQAAIDGWHRFGKGRHKAALNFGDCFAYALARERNAPLLFKGTDFSETDVKAAI